MPDTIELTTILVYPTSANVKVERGTTKSFCKVCNASVYVTPATRKTMESIENHRLVCVDCFSAGKHRDGDETVWPLPTPGTP